MGYFYFQPGYENYKELRLELSVLKTLPMIGPRIMSAAITTMATKTRISAYSTRPCPFSFGEKNMAHYLLSSEMFYFISSRRYFA
jgi:hypothetical protein